MVNATDLKNGTTFLVDGKPYRVVKYSLVKIGRGGAVVKLLVRNLESDSVEEKSYSSNIKVEEAVIQKRKLQFLYVDSERAFFTDPKSFEQTEVDVKRIKEELPFIKEGDSADILFWLKDAKDEIPLTIDIPPKVSLQVIDTAPGIKGNSAINAYKPARLENGLEIKVPLFIKKGDKVRVDTRTSQYVERVS